MGFFGAAYYLVPEEAERDIESPLIAYIQFGLLMFGALAAVVGYLFGIHEGRAVSWSSRCGSNSPSSSWR